MKAVIHDLQQTVSASRLNTFHQCRLKFYFRYVASVAKPPTSALFVGKVVHAVLQRWNLARWRRERPSVDFFRQLLEEEWNQLGKEESVAWKDDEEAQRQTAWAMLETYFQETPIPAEEKPQGVEVSVECDLVGLPKLIGIIDLVRPRGTIVDFKTSSTTPHPERTVHQNERQLVCYGLLYRAATGERESGFELHHLVKLKTPKVVVVPMERITPSQEARLFRGIESYVDGLERRDFVPSPGMTCLACEYFGECRAWTGGFVERRLAA